MNQKKHKPTLTWEDCAGVMDAFFDYMNDIATGRATAQHTKEGLYIEVLRRYNEQNSK